MVITRITGGLGNQLFQYAMGRRLAIHRNTELLLDASGYGPGGEWRPTELASFARPYALSKLRIQARVASPDEIDRLRDNYYRATARDRIIRQMRRVCPRFLWKESHIVERHFRFQPEALNWPDHVYLQGFWQSPRYFEDVSQTIRDEARLVDDTIEDSAAEHIASLRRKYGRVVSLHVRRGDLAHAVEVVGDCNLTFGAPVSMTYIERAMQEFSPDVCFIVFSDSAKDIAWCRENIHATHLEFSTAESDLWDFAAMRSCDDHIIANSTFSWWAAWLDAKPDRRVIAPRVWSSPSYTLAMPTDDLLPESWTVL